MPISGNGLSATASAAGSTVPIAWISTGRPSEPHHRFSEVPFPGRYRATTSPASLALPSKWVIVRTQRRLFHHLCGTTAPRYSGPTPTAPFVDAGLVLVAAREV